ncbi:SDR family NAD(P)-dependent oxidoreductase [Roseomonas sp. BN140053]|uniref:SDR family NAD(P)-dependent oxidoreductase n=1 Tax=Roseomonas sp. BN140053 TaxID=3391898 RepID=UPI0039ED17A6
MANRLANKVAVVTGGSRGIGASFAEALAAEGAAVVIADVMDGTATADRIAAAGGTAGFIRTDVTSEAEVAALFADTERRFGPVDALVNNAALFADLDKKPFTEIDAGEWDKVMAVNVRGPFLCARAAAPAMTRRGSGKIVNIASGTVFKGIVGMLHYVTSKGAVVAMTRCLARELGPQGICVNAIAPGLTMSEAVAASPTWQDASSQATVNSRAIRRDQLPQDLTGALVFLCSGDSDFMTGQTLVVDGGSVTH